MPRYHFTTTQSGKGRDGITVELPDLATAKQTATDFAAEVLREADGAIFEDDLSVEVTNESGLVLWLIIVTGIASAAAPPAR